MFADEGAPTAALLGRLVAAEQPRQVGPDGGVPTQAVARARRLGLLG